jgi:hypothetical protein
MGLDRVNVKGSAEQLEAIAMSVELYGRGLEEDDVRKLDAAARRLTRAIAYEAIRLGLEGWRVVRDDEASQSNLGSERDS